MIFLEDKNQTLQHFELTFDQEEIKQGFAKIAVIEPQYEPIKLHLELTENQKELGAYLIKGENKIELHHFEVSHPKRLYNN